MSRLLESKNADATCHRNRFDRNRDFNFRQRKFYLGDDTLTKLALIFEQLTGRELILTHMDSESAADVISSCINLMYNTLFFDGENQAAPLRDIPPKIEPPMSPAAFRKYRLYQQVRSRFNALSTGDKDKQKWKSVAGFLKENGIKKPRNISPSSMLSDGDWSFADIEALLNPERVNKLIAKNNEKFKARKDSLLSEPEV